MRGISLIELLIGLALMAVLLTLGATSYRAFLAENQAGAQITRLVNSINYARTEAIKRHTIVTMCKSVDGKNCGGNWNDGWIIFVDKTAQGIVPNFQALLRVDAAVPQGIVLKWQASRTNNYLQLNSQGGTRGQDGSFFYCPQDKTLSLNYRVVVSQTGRIRVEKLAKNEVGCG